MKNVKPGHIHPIVCLDAGHYGSSYNRSPVVPEYYESDAMWKYTQYEKTELERYGIEVWLTRKNQNQNPDLSARGRMSRDADLFVSNHSNACSTESVDRPVGIYLVDDDCGAIDEQSKEIAALLAETVREVMQTKNAAQTYNKLSDRDKDGDGWKNDDYYGVLYGAHQVGTPALIMEHSFHTNKAAAQWLLKDENLKLMAAAEAYTIAKWFGLTEADTAPSEPEDQDKATAVTVLVKGMKGPKVKALQILLMGYGGEPEKLVKNAGGADGNFGAGTEKALNAYKKAHGLPADGLCGAETLAVLLGYV